MKKIDLLFLDEKKKTSERIFEDLCFDNIKKEVFSEQEELFENFCAVLSHPLSDINAIYERKLILEDFCTYQSLATEIKAFCIKAKDYKIGTQKNTYHTLKDKLKNYIEYTIPLIELLDKFNNLFYHKSFKSNALSNIRRENYNELINTINSACEVISSRCVKLKVEFSNGFKLKSAMIMNCEKVKIKPKVTKKKEHVLLDENYISFRGMSMTQFIADDIYKATVQNLCSMISQINYQIQCFFKELKVSVLFYLAALELKKYFDINQLKYCFPEFVNDLSYGISAKGLYDCSLAAFNKGKNITTNDFDCSEGNILVITGLNQGGKTTFLRSIGIAQLFAQAGIFVPAEQYSCSCFNGILSHFPTEEDSNMDYGKLADELTRLRNDFPIVIDGSLALFNESFTTTTTREGAEIAVDVLRALSKTNSTVIFVTHLYELATKLEELNSNLYNDAKAISMVTEYNENDIRTYKILRGEPLKDIFASGYVF